MMKNFALINCLFYKHKQA